MKSKKVLDGKNRVLKAGGIVTRHNNAAHEVLLIRSRSQSWSFPKGHLEPNETIEQAAQREVLEETGYRTEIIKKLPILEYKNSDTGDDILVYLFQLKVTGGDMKKEFAHDELDWFSLNNIEDIFDRQNLKEYVVIIKNLLE